MTANTKATFYECWRRILMPILRARRIMLFVTGRMVYFDQIGSGCNADRSPCKALSVQLDLFDTDVILAALQEVNIPADQGETESLATRMDSIYPGGGHDLARRLHEIAGGVPRYVTVAVQALLNNLGIINYVLTSRPKGSPLHSDGAAGAAASGAERSGVVGGERDAARRAREVQQVLDTLFAPGGSVFNAVAEEAKITLNRAGAAIGASDLDDSAKATLVAGLLDLVFVQNSSFKLEAGDVASLRKATRTSMATPGMDSLINAAQFWGIHVGLDSAAGAIRFGMSPAILAALRKFLSEGALHGMLKPAMRYLKVDVTGISAEQTVGTALLLHQRMARLGLPIDWLGLHQHGRATAQTQQALGADTLESELKVLPMVTSNGKLRTPEEVRAILHGANDNRRLTPTLLGQFLASCPQRTFHAFATSPRSACADFITVYDGSADHLQVLDVEDLSEKLLLLREFNKTMPVARGAPGLRHRLVIMMMKDNARAHALAEFGSKNGTQLAEYLHGQIVVQCNSIHSGDQRLRAELEEVSRMIREGKLQVIIADAAQTAQFFEHYEVAKELIVGSLPGGWRREGWR